MTTRTIHFVTPSFHPAGGVVKIFDYVQHALHADYEVVVHCPERVDPSKPLFQIERFAGIADDSSPVQYADHGRFTLGESDLVFFSLPSDAPVAYTALRAGLSPHRIIHIIQGTRHSIPGWLGGAGLRQLTRPASRIVLNGAVMDSVSGLLDERGLTSVIPLGHETSYFRTDRGDLPRDRPLRVAHTTWKSDIGDRVAADVDPHAFEFRAVRETVSWDVLRTLYQWADVFLASPGPQEGFYLPGLEAMASGALVVIPDVGGNMDYCRPNQNCLLVDYEDEASYVAALKLIAELDQEQVAHLRQAGYATLQRHELTAERSAFHSFLDQVWDRVRQEERR